VEWDRDPGKGFKWFSPYWFVNEVERDGVTYIVSEISSIGLVNNPNIPEFRLANSVDANGREHVEAGSPEGGQFAPGEGSVSKETLGSKDNKAFREISSRKKRVQYDDIRRKGASAANGYLKLYRDQYHYNTVNRTKLDRKTANANRREAYERIREAHAAALKAGLEYDSKTHSYKDTKWSGYRAESYKASHLRREQR